jgi:hypothetical protein
VVRFFAHISQKGPVKYGQVPGSIGVLEAPDHCMPIGIASCRTWDEKGLAVWTPRIGKEEIRGRWVIVDREFQHSAMTRAETPNGSPRPIAISLSAHWIRRVHTITYSVQPSGPPVTRKCVHHSVHYMHGTFATEDDGFHGRSLEAATLRPRSCELASKSLQANPLRGSLPLSACPLPR